MTTYKTSKGSTIEIDGTAVTIKSFTGKVITGTLTRDQYLVRITDRALCAQAAKNGIVGNVYGWWEGTTVPEELALILNAGIAEISKRTPAESEREQIVAAYRKACTAVDPDQDWSDDQLRAAKYRYDRQMAAWAAKYPAQEAAHKAAAHKSELTAQIADLESMADGAMLYDADGSLSAADQQARHDDYKAQAQALRAQLASSRA